MAVWDSGQQVKTRMQVVGGGHEEREGTAQKRATPDSSESKQDSFPYFEKKK
jgi:hypothetical protein